MRYVAMLLVLFFSLDAMGEHLALFTEEYPPFNMSGKDGKAIGVSTEIVRELLNEDHLDFDIKVVPWKRAVLEAELVADTCVFSMSRTAERESKYQWVGPLVANEWAIFAKSGAPTYPSAIGDVKSSRIGSYTGDAIVEYLQSRDYHVDEAQSDDVNPNKLLNGRIDYWATGKLIGQYRLRQQKIDNIQPIFVFNKTDMYLACNGRTSPALIAHLNATLSDMRRHGAIDKIYARYGYSR
ncbi:MAG TPA: transporter substrate-binding domain-containing protein [Burkholderiaceae bacterium]|jgi:polar amino acid transport system substrate-binding protein